MMTGNNVPIDQDKVWSLVNRAIDCLEIAYEDNNASAAEVAVAAIELSVRFAIGLAEGGCVPGERVSLIRRVGPFLSVVRDHGAGC